MTFSRKWRLPGNFPAAMSHDEYRANITGLNIFFGAVIGVVMAGAESLAAWDFTILLLLSAGMVTTILHITASARRILYAVLAAILVWLLPLIFTLLSGGETMPAKLQPTLAAWVLMLVAIEFLPREAPATPGSPPGDAD